MTKRIEMRIYFEDEAPRIGCGFRRVIVLAGWKWVRVIEKSTGCKARFKRDAFEKIAPGVL